MATMHVQKAPTADVLGEDVMHSHTIMCMDIHVLQVRTTCTPMEIHVSPPLSLSPLTGLAHALYSESRAVSLAGQGEDSVGGAHLPAQERAGQEGRTHLLLRGAHSAAH